MIASENFLANLYLTYEELIHVGAVILNAQPASMQYKI